MRSRSRWSRSRSRLPRDELALAGWWFGKRVKNSAGLLPRSAKCACMSSFERRSHVSAARPAHLECAMRLQCEHSTAPFFAGSMHTRQLTATETISSQDKFGGRKRTFAKRRLNKGMFAYFKQVCVGLRDFRRDWRCTPCERAMAWRARQHRHVTVKCILGDRRIELEIRYQVSCHAIFLQVRAHPPKERYAILRSQVLCNIRKISLSFRY